jgi:(E)-4-hydroxy-3-methyl-but-2-enyl pyrophosphate reductase
MRALDIALKTFEEHPSKKIYTYGPLIHNPEVVELLRERAGIDILTPGLMISDSLVVTRINGIPPHERHELEEAGNRIIDATCPRICRVQAIIRRWAREGAAIIIVGDMDHPEVRGLMGNTQGRGYVVATSQEVAALPDLQDLIVVAQTTQSGSQFDARVAEIKARFPQARIFNTICDATASRQGEVQELARKVDALVVVGGRNSGNTQRLVEISRDTGIPTYHVETERELDLGEMSRYQTVGVTAGASTPFWLISDVVSTLKYAWVSPKDKTIIFHVLKDGKIQAGIRLTDGTWTFADGISKLPSGIYVTIYSKWENILKELEEIINDPQTKEIDLQLFFEKYPELLKGDDYNIVIPQACIIPDNAEIQEKPWRADYVLSPIDQTNFCKILEIKKPQQKMIRKEKSGHQRFIALLWEAINQLRDYAEAFNNKETRARFQETYEINVFKPDLQLIIGRKWDMKFIEPMLKLQKQSHVKIDDWDTHLEKLRRKFI